MYFFCKKTQHDYDFIYNKNYAESKVMYRKVKRVPTKKTMHVYRRELVI
jgi:hypothetical protein